MQEWKDPIVEEVRKAREELMEEAGDLENLFKLLKAGEARHPERLVENIE
ncbi:MAG: hypothetical protein WDZ91_01250 [Paenibacillaceae bacterium]